MPRVSNINPNELLDSFKDFFGETLRMARDTGRPQEVEKRLLSKFCLEIGAIDSLPEEYDTGTKERQHLTQKRNEVAKRVEAASDYDEKIVIEMSNENGYGASSTCMISVGIVAYGRRIKRDHVRIPTSPETGKRHLMERRDAIKHNSTLKEDDKNNLLKQIDESLTRVQLVQDFLIHTLSDPNANIDRLLNKLTK